MIHFARIGTLLMFSMFAFAQETSVSFKTTEVKPGIYMLQGEGGFTGGNLGLLTGDDGVVLIDDSMQPYSKLMLEAIAKVTGDPIDFVINTHVHGDHVGGNSTLGAAGTTIVAHHNIRKRLIEDGITGANGQEKAPKDALPTLTFSEEVSFHLNGHEAYVFHVAKAHTDGDAVIHFRDADVIHTGDILFNSLFPFIDLDTGGTVEGYLAAQERILSLCTAQTVIMPGHGPVADRAALQAAHDMLKDARRRVMKLVDEGKTQEEIVALNPLADYHDEWNWGFITTERMTETLIRSLRK